MADSLTTDYPDMATQGRVKAILVFNKASNVFMHAQSWSDPATLGGQDLFVFVEDEWDFINDTVVGNYPDYVVQDKTEGPQVVYESQLDARVAYKITKKYNIADQLNVIGKVVSNLAEHAGFDPDAENDPTGYGALLEMLDYIAQVKAANAATRAHYIESPDYIYVSNEEAENELADRSAGGVHEWTGAREITGGSVFT